MKLLNAFTPAMMEKLPAIVRFEEVTEAGARVLALAGLESCVGHQASADLYAVKLGIPVPMNRVNVRLVEGDSALIGQYQGPRLPEGRILTTEELGAAGIKWILVSLWPSPT
jgi:hypothetical protein